MGRWVVALLGFLAASPVLTACHAEEGGGDTGPGPVDCSREPALDWDNYASGFFDKNCNGCHSSSLEGDARYDAPPGVNFDSEDVALQYADRIRQRVLVDQTMPPGAGLTATEQRMLDEWLLCAAGSEE